MKRLTLVPLLVGVLAVVAVAQPNCATTVTAPNTETFDSGTTGSHTTCTSTGSAGVLPAGWVLDASSTTPWIVNSGGTSSSTTGPSSDHTSGAGNYLYVETSGTCNGLVATLLSPCYDVSGINPNLQFFYHAYGVDCSSIRVDSWDGASWVTVFESMPGDQGDQWNQVDVGLYTFVDAGVNKSAIRIIGYDNSDTGFYGDIAIDDVTVADGLLTPPLAEWQMNQTAMSMDVDGAEGSSISPATVQYDLYNCLPIQPQGGNLHISSDLPGAAFDVVISSAPLVGGFSGGIALPDGQFVNVSLTSPLVFASTGTAAMGSLNLPGLGFPGATNVDINLGMSFSAATTATLQAFVFNPAAPIGVSLGQATQIDAVMNPVPTSVAGPTLVSTNTTLNVSSVPTCWFAGGVPFYGTNYSEIFISPNGFIAWGGGGDTDGSPSITDALNDDGRVGFWTDLDPSEGGNITVSNPAPNLLRVDYAGVFYNTGGPGNTFGIEVDVTTGVIVIDGLGGISPNPNTSSTLDDQWIGISPGLTAATTDPGAALFGSGASGAAANPFDMLYEFNDVSVTLSGLPASIAGGMTSLIFTPDGLGNYQWAGF